MTTRQELETLVKRASDKMRADDNTKLVTKYVEHLSWLLFLKVHEAVEDEQELLDSSYQRIIRGDFRWSVWTGQEWRAEDLISFVNNDLLPYLRGLNSSKGGKLIATLFLGVTTVMKSGFGLKEVIGIVNEIDFHSQAEVHTFSVVYEALLSRLGREAGWSGEFYTPRPIVQLMVRIVNPQLGERVYDPAAGSAGFLAESFEHMRQGERTLADYASLREATFFGQESGELPFLLGSMNLILHGITLPDIVRHNTLEQDVRGIPADQQYDVILTNPPFGGKENPQIQQNFPIKSAATEILFLQHVMSFLSVNGRAAIVLPDGILFREERSFYRARVRLVEDFNLTAIIRLPPGVFPYATATRTNLVMFDRGSATKSVRFYRVSAPTESGFGKTRPIGSDDLQGAFEWVCNGEANPNSWEVSLDEIRKGRYDLDLLPPEEANELEPEALAVRVATFATEARAATELLEPLRRVETSSDAFAFDRIALLGEYVLERGARAKSVKPTNFIGVTNTGGIAPFKGEAAQNTSRYRLVDVGDFVYNPMRINVGSIGLCRTEAEAGYTSPDYVVFRLRDDAPISAEYVLLYLQSLHGRHQIERNTQGSVRSRLYFANLCKVRIPIPAKPEAWESVGAASRILVLLPRELSAALAPLLDGLLRWSPSLSPSPEPGNIEDEGEEEGEEEGEDEDECEETDDE